MNGEEAEGLIWTKDKHKTLGRCGFSVGTSFSLTGSTKSIVRVQSVMNTDDAAAVELLCFFLVLGFWLQLSAKYK